MTRLEVFDSADPDHPRIVESVTPRDPAARKYPRDYGYEAQQAAEKHLTACWEWMEYEDNYEEGDPPPDFDNPAVGPFDGCQTCEVREVLAVAWPFIEAMVRDEIAAENT